MHVCVQSHFSRVRLCAALWTVVHQASLSIEFCRQQYWSGFPCPPPGDLQIQRSKLHLMSPALAGRFLTTNATWEAQMKDNNI